MKVMLAGYNIDHDILSEIRAALPHLESLTPETVAAAYARISRSPKQVDELRASARQEIDKARRSNEAIVFDMGHSSIAEHAVFNLDILGVSRLLVEEIEKFRLCSYTEKSQRYVLFQDDFVIPDEIRRAGLQEPFAETIRLQHHFYHDCYDRLKPYVLETHKDLAADPAMRSTLDGWAKEDARYIIALATETQLGMTANARNLELMLRRLAAHPLAEAQGFSRDLYSAVKSIAPSLIRYTEATGYDLLTRSTLKDLATSLEMEPVRTGGEDVLLIQSTPNADQRIAACLLHASSDRSLVQCLEAAERMTPEEQETLIKTALRHIKAHDQVLREFEHAELLFELTVSASCFAQLKRHRMATLTCQDYDPSLGVTVPPAIAAVGMEKPFLEVIDRTNETYAQIKKEVPAAAAYVLTNAHRRRVALTINPRELYHMARLRADGHAQWDIRQMTEKMLVLGRKVMPLALMLAVGKDGFHDRYKKIFS